MTSGNPAIVIVGIACRFADACNPRELWENVLAQRRAFRAIPPQRLCLADYFSADPDDADAISTLQAALIEGYEFDRVHFRVARETFQVTDMAHWLALDVASQALADAGFPDGVGLPRATTGVLVGNTLTGEFSRANLMRLRWPYVRRTVAATLLAEGLSDQRCEQVLAQLETRYKKPFPIPNAESLAGGLANTIAGRIANHFDLGGGGYVVDGACASSLLAVATACSGLTSGDIEVALVGGVDLSLDPFELVGFARTGALAGSQMRVFDQAPTGFLPGEGCGFVVLARHDWARSRQLPIRAVIRGWGVSSDGGGGLTRPAVAGQLLAIERAYSRAGFGIATVDLFEGHGTGTAIGDATELAALNQARRPTAAVAAIGSIKANIGHTKAAAGVAGLIKATMAVRHRLLPPTTGCVTPHAELSPTSTLRILGQAEPGPADRPLRAGVSAMGFGGINAHLVIEGVGHARPSASVDMGLLRAPQDAELIVVAAGDRRALGQQVEHLQQLAPGLSQAELGDLAAELAGSLPEVRQLRAAVVAATPSELAQRLQQLASWLDFDADGNGRIEPQSGLFLGWSAQSPRVGLLFPGQGSPISRDGGAWRRRFDTPAEFYPARPEESETNTAEVQPAIVSASLAALAMLTTFGVKATVAVGHSLGELTALHWAGALDRGALLRLAAARGRAMSEFGCPEGAMASIDAPADAVTELLAEYSGALVIAGYNGPRQTTISGPSAAVHGALVKAQANAWRGVRLPVSHAFHSPLIAAAEPAVTAALAAETFLPLTGRVFSTVTGARLAVEEDLPALLKRQVTAPVRFDAAVQAAAQHADVFLEAGPGSVLSQLVATIVPPPTIALDAGGESLGGLLRALGGLFALGAPVRLEKLFDDRFTRPFRLDRQARFFVNPCEQAEQYASRRVATATPAKHQGSPAGAVAAGSSPLVVVRQLLAERTELPLAAISAEARLLDDLHLNSIAVGQLVAEAARSLGTAPPIAPTEFANVSVSELAEALQGLIATAGPPGDPGHSGPVPGIDSWVHPFTVVEVERPLAGAAPRLPEGSAWQVFGATDDPFKPSIEAAFRAQSKGSGVVLLLPAGTDQSIDLLLAASRAANEVGREGRFVLVQRPGSGGAAFVRTLHLEARQAGLAIVDLPAHPESDPDRFSALVVAEAAAVTGFEEARYDSQGRRFQPLLRLLPEREALPEAGLTADDLLLVSGGGKGIGAECALALARDSGARLILLGRSHPDRDEALRANLDRLAAAGVRAHYLLADVSRLKEVQAALATVVELGPVSAILHAAGSNQPRLIVDLEAADVKATLAAKVTGLDHLLAAVDPAALKLLITFGSLIARTGLRGEADYGLANQWLRERTEGFAHRHPQCRCLCVEWSVWSGVGMGARLGRVEALAREGITPITPEVGVAILRDLIARPPDAVAVVVSGRLGDLPTVRVEASELPLQRFLERPRVHYPGLELVVESDLSLASDPYLADHIFAGQTLLPAVIGLEAMAQAAAAVSGCEQPPVFTDVGFEHALALGGDGVTLRVACLMADPGRLEVAVRSSATAFRAEHFRATCCFAEGPAEILQPPLDSQKETILVDPKRDLYGRLLFQAGRFRCLRRYRRLSATVCEAEIAAVGSGSWFGRYLPERLRLGDPGIRDAAIHAIQATIPHATVLPVAVERLTAAVLAAGESYLVTARERSAKGSSLIWDLEIRHGDGSLAERWEGLELRIMDSPLRQPHLAPALLGPYLERRLRDLLSGPIQVGLTQASHQQRRARSQLAVHQLLGAGSTLRWRPDGKPEVEGGPAVSISHSRDLVLVVAGREVVGCDLEPVTARPTQVWRDLLGDHRQQLAQLIAAKVDDGDLDRAATRVWSAAESLRKAGAMADTPLLIATTSEDGWALLQAGKLQVATAIVPGSDSGQPLAVAVVTGIRAPAKE